MTRRVLAPVAFVLALATTRAHAQTPPVTVGGDHPRQRQEFFEYQRAYPFEKTPPGAYMRARLAAMRLPRASISAGVLSNMSAWTQIGPLPITNNNNAGRVSAIAIHPVTTNVIYIGAAQGGVWKTTNGGSTWTPLTDNECSLAIGSVTLDPVNPNIVYAGTGEENFSADSYYGCGVLRSTDAGQTWTTLGQSVFQTSTGGARIGKILVDPSTAGTTNAVIYAATTFGLYKSVGGGTWTQVLSRGFGPVTDVVAPAVPGLPLLAAATTTSPNAANGIYRSFDGGTTWTLLTAGLPSGGNVGRIALSVSPFNQSVIYAAISDATTGNLMGIYRTNDGGTTWALFPGTGTNCSTQCWYAITVGASPLDTNTVFFGGLSLYRSADRGTTFSTVGGSVHVDHHAIAFDPQTPTTVYVGTDGGVYRSLDGGSTWTNLNNGLSITQFYAGVSLHPTLAAPILAGTQDNGTVENVGGTTWFGVIGGDGGFTAINPLNPNISYGETQWGSSGGPRRRTTPNGSFSLVRNGINSGDRAIFIPPLVIDPAHPHLVYFGTSKLYRTRDGGDSWTAISPDVSATASITSIGVAQSDTQVVYVGTTSAQVQVTTNGGGSWTTGAGLPNRVVTDVVVYPGSSEIAYATVSGFGTGHVFKTVNRGLTWTNISSNLPNVPVNAIVIIPGGELFVGTDLGVYRSGDDGASWGSASLGLANVAVFDLAYSLSTQTLVAATHGRSMWAATVTPVLAATQLFVDNAPTGAVSGVALNPVPTISIRELTGVTIPGANNQVTAAITVGSGALTGTTTVTAVNGVARFTNLIVVGGGTNMIAFTSPGLSTVTRAVVTTVGTGSAIAQFAPDSIEGAQNDKLPLDLNLDLSGMVGTSLGAYNVRVTWDSLVVRLDSVRAVPGGYTAPAATVVDARTVVLAAADATGLGGRFGLARMFFRFVGDASSARSTVTPQFTSITSTTGANLQANLAMVSGVAAQRGVLRGDVTADGALGAGDAQAILQAAVGLTLAPPMKALQNGDANCNGKLEVVDAQIVLAFLVGLPVAQFCVNKVR